MLMFAALMLQESNPDQSVESPAQARGLSQLMASTRTTRPAPLVGTTSRPPSSSQPQTSITLGAYTFERVARYDQQIVPALADYNASAYAVDRLLLAAGNAGIDIFTEASLQQTYPYVQRIYENYHHYLDLYGTQANP